MKLRLDNISTADFASYCQSELTSYCSHFMLPSKEIPEDLLESCRCGSVWEALKIHSCGFIVH